LRRVIFLALQLGATAFAADAGVASVRTIKDPFAGLPEVVSVVPLVGEMSSMGVPVMARAMRTRLKPKMAQRWVVGSFRRNDLYIPPPDGQFQLEGAPQLTGYDPDALRTYTAVFKENEDGSTTLICGTADLSRQEWAKSRASLPVLPAAKQVLESRLEGSLSVSYVVQATEGEVRSFYGEVLGSAGWAPHEEAHGWSKGTQLITLEQTASEGGLRRVVVLERSAGASK
jgi:hypothetical protein